MKRGNIKKINRYATVNISDKTASGMHLTNDDRHYLERMFMTQDQNTEEQIDEAYRKHREILVSEVRDMLVESLKEIKTDISQIKSDISEIKTDLKNVKDDVAELTKRVEKLESRVLKLECK